MDKKPTVTIGIPAYNEEANIRNLLKSLLHQTQNNYQLERILVVSDGSTDSTVNEIFKIKSKKIQLVLNIKRLGQMGSQNKIMRMSKSNILVLLNADILPIGKKFIEKLINPILKSADVGLVGAKIVPLDSKNIFESILVHSKNIKRSMYEKLKDGNNVFLCHGRARAFSKKLYKRLKFPNIQGEDAYSYLECKRLNLHFVYQKSAAVTYRCPSNFKDHIKQSTRFYQSQNDLINFLPIDFIKNEYSIPRSVLLKHAILGFIKNPLKTLSYVSVLTLCKILFLLNLGEKNYLWQISQSSKRL